MNTLERIITVALDISLWTGRKKLSPEDLGLDPAQLPPEKLATLGTKKIVDPEALTSFNTLKRRAERACEAVGVRFLGSYAVPQEKTAALMAELKEIQAEFNAEKNKFLLNYDTQVNDWIAANPEWSYIIRAAIEPAAHVAHRIAFSMQAFRVSGVEGLDEGLKEQAENLSYRLIQEIGRMAKDCWESSFRGRATVTRKALRPLKAMMEKLRGLEFLDPQLGPLVKRIDDSVSSIPKEGPIEGKEFNALVGVLHMLADLGGMLIVKEPEQDPVEEITEEPTPAREIVMPAVWF